MCFFVFWGGVLYWGHTWPANCISGSLLPLSCFSFQSIITIGKKDNHHLEISAATYPSWKSENNIASANGPSSKIHLPTVKATFPTIKASAIGNGLSRRSRFIKLISKRHKESLNVKWWNSQTAFPPSQSHPKKISENSGTDVFVELSWAVFSFWRLVFMHSSKVWTKKRYKHHSNMESWHCHSACDEPPRPEATIRSNPCWTWSKMTWSIGLCGVAVGPFANG